MYAHHPGPAIACVSRGTLVNIYSNSRFKHSRHILLKSATNSGPSTYSALTIAMDRANEVEFDLTFHIDQYRRAQGQIYFMVPILPIYA